MKYLMYESFNWKNVCKLANTREDLFTIHLNHFKILKNVIRETWDFQYSALQTCEFYFMIYQAGTGQIGTHIFYAYFLCVRVRTSSVLPENKTAILGLVRGPLGHSKFR